MCGGQARRAQRWSDTAESQRPGLLAGRRLRSRKCLNKEGKSQLVLRVWGAQLQPPALLWARGPELNSGLRRLCPHPVSQKGHPWTCP